MGKGKPTRIIRSGGKIDKRFMNQFWKNIDPKDIGRTPMFETPIDMFHAFLDYQEYTKSNPYLRKKRTASNNAVGSDIIEFEKPLSWSGFYAYLLTPGIDRYRKKDEFAAIIKLIDNIMYTDKYSGAAAGVYNSNIIAYELGIKNKPEPIELKAVIDISNASTDELLKRAAAVQKLEEVKPIE